MSAQGSNVTLSEDDIAFVMTLLRNASSPLTTARIVAALKERTSR